MRERKEQKEAGASEWMLVSSRRRQFSCPDNGSVHGLSWPCGEPICCHVVVTTYDLSGIRREVSMTCSDRSHPPCSYCWDGAQRQLPP
jgi:hypothetical protein